MAKTGPWVGLRLGRCKLGYLLRRRSKVAEGWRRHVHAAKRLQRQCAHLPAGSFPLKRSQPVNAGLLRRRRLSVPTEGCTDAAEAEGSAYRRQVCCSYAQTAHLLIVGIHFIVCRNDRVPLSPAPTSGTGSSALTDQPTGGWARPVESSCNRNLSDPRPCALRPPLGGRPQSGLLYLKSAR